MKSKLRLAALGLLLCWQSLQAQITIAAASGPQVGDTIHRKWDDNPTVVPGAAGAAMVWNFTTVAVSDSNTTRVVTPSATPWSGYFPGANQAMTSDNVNYVYLNSGTANVVLQGLAGDLLGNGNNLQVPFAPTPVIQQYPIAFGNTFMDNYGFDVTTSGNTWAVYQIRMKRLSEVRDTIDAWGEVTTPIGTYNCLRHKHIDYSLDTVWIKLLFFSPWTIYSIDPDTTVSYSWLGEESGLPIAELTLDSARVPDRFTWTMVPPAPVALFSWVDQGNGNVAFTDLSGNSPASWSWDYGDGSALGTAQHPNHAYLGNGTYWACLTVTNVTGSNFYCDSVTVTGFVAADASVSQSSMIAIAPNPAADWVTVSHDQNGNAEGMHLQCLDAQGKLVMDHAMPASADANAVRMDVSSLPAGYYFLLLLGNDGQPLGRAKLAIAR